MMVEAYIALAILAVLFVIVPVFWADSFYQEIRREQRLKQRGLL